MSRLPFLALLLAGTPADALRIEPGTDPARVRVVAKLPAEAARLPQGKLTQDQGEAWLRLALVNEDNGRDGSPMFGAYERQGGRLVFTPRYPLLHGARYRARLGPEGGKGPAAEYRVPPRPEAPSAVVEQIYPSAAVLPANQLRFHIRFSKPMRGGDEIFDQIRILDADGKAVANPWLRDELWSADDRSLILYIHPGRIKWGVLLRMLFGPVLVPGGEYTVVIGADMRDLDGRPLGKAYSKKFRTGPEDRTRIELNDWKVQAPAAGMRGPLVLSFPKPIDRLALERRLKVITGDGKQVAGRIEVGGEERTWAFHPAEAWKAAGYRVEVSRDLEDVAGNSPLRPFDMDRNTPERPAQSLSLPFRPRPADSGAAR